MGTDSSMLFPQLSAETNVAIAYIGYFGGTGLLCLGINRSKTTQQLSYAGFLIVAFVGAFVNYHYGIQPVGSYIAFFNGLYDPFYNIIPGNPSGNVTEHPGLIPCLGDSNACSILGYKYHASWAANFYHRFTTKSGAAFNRARLCSHV